MYNIPGAYLQTNWPEDNDCYLKFDSLMVKMIFKTDPSYEKYVLTNAEMPNYHGLFFVSMVFYSLFISIGMLSLIYMPALLCLNAFEALEVRSVQTHS